jgi:hypothetical protein
MFVIRVVEIWLLLNTAFAAALLARVDPPEHVEPNWRRPHGTQS